MTIKEFGELREPYEWKRTGRASRKVGRLAHIGSRDVFWGFCDTDCHVTGGQLESDRVCGPCARFYRAASPDAAAEEAR